MSLSCVHRQPDNHDFAYQQGDPNVPKGQVTFEVDLRRPVTEDTPIPEGELRQFELPQVYEARYTDFPRAYQARWLSYLLWVFLVSLVFIMPLFTAV